ncbi:MAG: hypothetical protein HY691_00860 [Chloroflexi bacterium]|nr:hypothetical protein [Chloroflexota bacterium]
MAVPQDDELTGEIDDFFEQIEEAKRYIDNLHDPFRALQLMVLLDVLAKCAFPKERNNKQRFIGLIDHHSDWEYKDCVSIIQLSHLFSGINRDDRCQARNRSRPGGCGMDG